MGHRRGGRKDAGALSGWFLGQGRKDLAGLQGSVRRLWYAGGR
jgi:hypothetical protein